MGKGLPTLRRIVDGDAKTPSLLEISDTQELDIKLQNYFGTRIDQGEIFGINDLLETCKDFKQIDTQPSE